MLRISVWNIAFTIINILVLFFFMRHFLMKPVMEILEERKKLVERIWMRQTDQKSRQQNSKRGMRHLLQLLKKRPTVS